MCMSMSIYVFYRVILQENYVLGSLAVDKRCLYEDVHTHTNSISMLLNIASKHVLILAHTYIHTCFVCVYFLFFVSLSLCRTACV